MAAALLCAGVAGWVSFSGARFGAQLSTIQQQLHGQASSVPPMQELGYLWSMPSDSLSSAGLGGGLTFQFDPRLCDQMQGRFRERILSAPLVGCDDLKSAVHRAFTSWSANHPAIHFLDVTSECEAIGQPGEGCHLAEIWITAIGDEAETTGVGSSEGTAAAFASTYGRLTDRFVYTNGQQPFTAFDEYGSTSPRQVFETYKATMTFNSGLCWYLDSTFCSRMHLLKQASSPGAVLLIVKLLLFVTFALSAVIVLGQLVWLLRATCRGDGDDDGPTTCVQKLERTMDVISKWSTTGLLTRLVLLWAPPILYFSIFLPCWDCYDFEAAATHEVGHVLGLSHPDRAALEVCDHELCGPPGQNLFHIGLASGAARRMDNASCAHPWDDVAVFSADAYADAVAAAGVLGKEAEELSVGGATGVPFRKSIMEAFTQNNPEVCLFADDLEAITVLYPACSHAISAPACYKVQHNIGWLRLLANVGTPVLASTVFVLLLAAVVRRHHLRVLQRARHLAKAASRDLRSARGHATRHRAEVRELERELHAQRLTEKERVESQAQAIGVTIGNDLAREHIRRATLNAANAQAAAATLARGQAAAPAAAAGSIPTTAVIIEEGGESSPKVAVAASSSVRRRSFALKLKMIKMPTGLPPLTSRGRRGSAGAGRSALQLSNLEGAAPISPV